MSRLLTHHLSVKPRAVFVVDQPVSVDADVLVNPQPDDVWRLIQALHTRGEDSLRLGGRWRLEMVMVASGGEDARMGEIHVRDIWLMQRGKEGR